MGRTQSRQPKESRTQEQMMIRSYLTTALRSLYRHKGFSAINIVGLAFGMTSSLLIYLYVWHELNYDTYHPDHERIFRISTQMNDEGIAGCSEEVADYLRVNCPEVEQVFRTQPLRPAAVRSGNRSVQVDNIQYADNGLLGMFKMPVIQGDGREALARPRTAVLTRSWASRLFGDEPAVGKTIFVDTMGCEVTAVVEDSPTNTHLKFDIILSWATMDAVDHSEWRHSWYGGFFKTYIRLAKTASAAEFEKRIASLITDHASETLRQRGQTATLFLQPVADIHLGLPLRFEAEAPGNLTYIWVLATVGGIILLIASLNFVNLSTARSATRATEVGLRKAIGASRGQVLRQFLGEMILTAALALMLALVIADLALPSFNQLAGTRFHLSDILIGPGVVGIVGIIVITGGLAGLYPAFVLSSFRPARVLKGKASSGNAGATFRRVVVTLQFVMAIVLISGVLIVFSQIRYMRSQALGFEPKQKLVIEMPSEAVSRDSHQSVKSEFMSNPLVKGATFSSSVPGRWNYEWRTFPTGEEATNNQSVNWYSVDLDFISNYEIDIIRGLSLGPGAQGVILNEAAVAAFGWTSPEEALTKELFARGTPVVGIAKNFHFRGLQSPVEPLAMAIIREDFRYLTLCVNAGDAAKAVDAARQKFGTLFPEALFNYFFLDQDFDRQYRAETQLGAIFGVFTVLGIVVAALGLFGLASYSAQQRTKEIGIRKVLGAGEGDIVGLVTGEILIIVATAVVLAWPIAYLAGTTWLKQFAFRTSVEWATLLLAAGIGMAIAVVSVGYQALRAARANPVDSLKYE